MLVKPARTPGTPKLGRKGGPRAPQISSDCGRKSLDFKIGVGHRLGALRVSKSERHREEVCVNRLWPHWGEGGVPTALRRHPPPVCRLPLASGSVEWFGVNFEMPLALCSHTLQWQSSQLKTARPTGGPVAALSTPAVTQSSRARQANK